MGRNTALAKHRDSIDVIRSAATTGFGPAADVYGRAGRSGSTLSTCEGCQYT
jgi:hypothetical protein